MLPIFIMFVSSLKDLLEAFKLPAVGDWSGVGVFFDFTPTFKHYHNLFADLNFTRLLRQQPRSPPVGSALVSVVLGSMCAYALSRIEFRGKKDLFFWIISTRMAPVVAVMVPLYAIFRSAGLVGTVPGLILAYTTFNLPFAIWILKGFFDNVPYAIEEAAMCDGCHPASRRFARSCRWWRPASAPSWSCACCSPGTTSCSPRSSAPAAPRRCRSRPRELVQPQNIQWGSIMAAGVVTTLPMMFLGLLIRRYLVTGLTMGAVRE